MVGEEQEGGETWQKKGGDVRQGDWAEKGAKYIPYHVSFPRIALPT